MDFLFLFKANLPFPVVSYTERTSSKSRFWKNKTKLFKTYEKA